MYRVYMYLYTRTIRFGCLVDPKNPQGVMVSIRDPGTSSLRWANRICSYQNSLGVKPWFLDTQRWCQFLTPNALTRPVLTRRHVYLTSGSRVERCSLSSMCAEK